MSSATASQEPQTAPTAAKEETPIFLRDGTRATVNSGKMSSYDFRSRSRLSQADLRNMDALCQRYVRHLAARLSIFLRMECAMKPGTLTSSPFSKFCESMAPTSCVTLFAIEQLRGVGILDVSLPLALAMADRLLGGKGRAPADERPLTEIEMALLEDALQMMLVGWSDLWTSEDQRLQPRIIGHENSGRCLQTAGPDEVFVLLLVEVSIGETASQFQMGVPFSMIEHAVRKLEQAQQLGGELKLAKPVQWRKPYEGIAVPILAEWKVREMPLSETLRISKGDVIELPGTLISEARLRLAEIETFVGTVGIQNGHVAVQITGRSGGE